MCHINIIHFSHHHNFFPSAEEVPNTSPSSNTSFTSSITSSSSISNTSTTYNNCNLSNPNRLTRQEELISLQHLPQHQFIPCTTHTNHHCVIYKQTMPCLLQRFHSSPPAAAAAGAAAAADTTTPAAEINANANASPAEHEGGVINVSTCPNLELTNEYHPLRLLLADNDNTTTTNNVNININNSENGKSMPGGGGGVQPQPFQTLSQAKTTLLSTADALHQQIIKLNTHILETVSLLESLFQKLAAAHTTHTQPTKLLQRAQTRALLMQLELELELEIPLQRATKLCQEINLADAKISELFQTFLQRRQEMADLLVAVAVENKEGTDCGVYTISKARQDLRELSTENIREVCEEPMRRGREVVREVVRVLEGVEKGMLHMGV